MAKAIPKKKKRAAEIAELVSPKAQKKQERRIQGYLMDLDGRAEERENYAATILSANDDSVEAMVENMVKQLRIMQGEPKLIFEGQVVNPSESDAALLLRIQTRNFRWIAVRCLVACAEWDIKLGNFKLPKKRCARCGKKVGKAHKHRKISAKGKKK